MISSLNDIAQHVNGVVIGDAATAITSISSIDDITPGSLVFADTPEYFKKAEDSAAAAIMTKNAPDNCSKPVLQVQNPMRAFIALIQHFHPQPQATAGIHPTAVIAADVILGQNVFIGPYVVIEEGSVIGDYCVLKSHIHIGRQVNLGNHTTVHAHVTIYDHCHIGSQVTIHASTVIGSDGFGYTFDEGKHQKIPHVGNVVVHDDVEIGANTAIDRATMGSTVIGQGTKIDNLVQVAHSVKLGKHNILCGFTGIAGSTQTGNNVIFAANCGISDHVRIDDGVILGARSGVPPHKHLLSGNIYIGSPARPKDLAIKQELGAARIPAMRKTIKNLTEQVAVLTKKMTQLETEQS